MPKPATIKEIATKLKVSVSTVSRALHDHPSIGLRTKTQVQQLAAELNYEPNKTAIFFKQGKTFTIGVILPNLSEDFFSMAITGIEQTAFKHSYNVLMGQSHDQPELEKRITATMKDHRVDGLLISLAKDSNDFSHFEQLEKYNIPVVFFDRIPTLKNIHSVSCNLKPGMTEAVNFLLKKGHKRIGLINGPASLKATGERLEGYTDALRAKKIKSDNGLVVTTDLSKENTHAATQQLLALKNPPTAIITFNDYVALDAIQYVRKMKKKINRDISFVSYANLPITHYLDTPPLASVEQFPREQGERAMEIMLQLLTRGDEVKNNNRYFQEVLESRLELIEV
jgi:LacI family transcriptional regulator